MAPVTKLLIVDDEPLVRTHMADFVIERLDMRPVLAPDMPGALAVLAAERVDLVLLDIVMPGMDGLAVLQWIKAAQSALPVIMVTASAKVEDAVEALRLGAEDFVRKPLDFDLLAQTIARVLQRGAVEQPPKPVPDRAPGENRRRTPRIRLLAPGQLQLREVTVIDLSLEGALVEHSEQVHLSQVYRLAFALGAQRLQVLARAVRSYVNHRLSLAPGEGQIIYRTGLEFVGLDKATSQAIAAYAERQR
jgi:DNA-binding response OmpR family regulator